MKKISPKSVVIALVAFVTCVVLGMAVFILIREDKPVYKSGVDTHDFISNSDGHSEHYECFEFKLGPDITGKSYGIKVCKNEPDEGQGSTFISINNGKKQKIADDSGESGYLCNVISMIDENGKPVIIVNMDHMSDDYFFVVYTIEDGRLVKCDSDGAFVTKANIDRTFTAEYRVDFFGTWHGERTIKLTGGNRIQLVEGDYKLNNSKLDNGYNSRKLTAKVNVKAEIVDADGNYKSYTIKKGSVISLYATDGQSYVLFTDAKGNKGRLKANLKDGYTLIGKKSDFDLFDGIMYAG